MLNSSLKQLASQAWLHALALGAAVVVCYFGLWNAYFTTDDFWMLGWVRHKASFAEAIWAQFGYSLRVLLDAMLYVRVRLFDLNPAPYYWISIAQHAIVTVLVYALVRLWSGSRGLGFVTALIYGTAFSYFEVITWITGSNYSLAAIPYLASLGLLGVALRDKARWAHWASVACFVIALLLTELPLTLPLVLLAYHFFFGWGNRSLKSLRWQEVAWHAPYWIALAVYLLFQFEFVRSGSSEATVATVAYRPGLHMPGNLFFFAYLIVPPYVPGVLAEVTGISLTLIDGGLAVLAILIHGLAAYLLWRGPALLRFAVAFMYLTFLPYTLWEGAFAGALRYRYLPAIGFSLLVAWLLLQLHARWQTARGGWRPVAVPALVAAIVAVNILFVQVWVQRHLESSAVRRTVVTGLAARAAEFAPGARIYLEVPEAKFIDLGNACELLFDQPMTCTAFVTGQPAPTELTANVFWYRVAADGLQQIFPAAATQ